MSNQKITNIYKNSGLEQFARKTSDGSIYTVWAKDLEEAVNIMSGNKEPYDVVALSNKLYREHKINAANAL